MAISRTIPLFMVVAWLFNVALLVRSIVYEKEKRLKEVMHMMGLTRAMHWSAWFITSMVMMVLSTLLLLLVLKVQGVRSYHSMY